MTAVDPASTKMVPASGESTPAVDPGMATPAVIATPTAVTASELAGEKAPPLRPVPVPRWLRLAFRMVSAVSPRLARRLAHRLFFTPLPARRRPEDQRVLDTGLAFELEGRFGRIGGWSWNAHGHTHADGPLVLLAHGWGGNAGQMTAVVEPLRAAGFRVVALDMPAHGRSTGKQSSLVHFADAIERAAARLGPLRGIIAHSFGSAATTVALGRGLAVSRVVYVAPSADFETFFRRFRAGLDVSDPIWAATIREAERWLDVVFDDLVPVALAPAQRVPLLVVHDRADREVAYAEGARLASVWPGATLHATQGLGHLRILRDPGVTALMTRFMIGPRSGT